jgi:gamma-glutamylaminecyclotransferase
LFAAGVPFVNPDLPRTPVRGELFSVSLADLPKLDKLEGHPDFYYRELVRVVPLVPLGDAPAGAKPVDAWLYFNRFVSDLADSKIPAVFVASGDFRDADKYGNPSS